MPRRRPQRDSSSTCNHPTRMRPRILKRKCQQHKSAHRLSVIRRGFISIHTTKKFLGNLHRTRIRTLRATTCHPNLLVSVNATSCSHPNVHALGQCNRHTKLPDQIQVHQSQNTPTTHRFQVRRGLIPIHIKIRRGYGTPPIHALRKPHLASQPTRLGQHNNR